MDIPFDSWHKAIYLRHSQRKYSGEIPDDEVTERIERVCNEFRPFPGARAVLVRDPAKEVFKGAVGEFFYKVTQTPYYITFIGDMNSSNVQSVMGYLGEGVILEATALGLNTCWVGGFYRPEEVLKQINLEEGERVLGITPIGYSKEESDRVGVSSKQYRRKDLSNLIISGDADESWVKTAVEAARIAPSAGNRQPWRFDIDEDSITVSTNSRRRDFRVSRRLDCGISMLHIELGALVSGVKGSWEFLEHPEVARYRIN
ncbi:MAG: nitroreductase family protein [Candidatus Thorarchaeota archaeon]|nr:nitroreductase family protein [Candidatus Thorarchaeota archaeon]